MEVHDKAFYNAKDVTLEQYENISNKNKGVIHC